MADRRRKYVRVRTWDTTNKGFFPERHDPEVRVQALDDRDDLGICFSGGGTRSASASLGQLRALHSLGLLKRARYISAVSGGSWTAVPYTYLPDGFDDETFLGPKVSPSQLREVDLQYAPKGSMAMTIHRSVVFDNILKNWLKLRGDESYARAIGDIFLDRFGLDETSKFFTWDQTSISAVLANNSPEVDGTSYLQASDFVTARSGRPYLIIGATLLFGEKSARQTVVPMEITPLYTGCRQHIVARGSDGADVGGCYVESFGYDSKFKKSAIGSKPLRVRFWSRSNWRRRSKYFFTLADAVGTSGAAPAEKLREKKLTNVGFPEFRHWSTHSLEKGHAEYQHGDGGFADNLGIMPLLARQTTKIIVFVNSPTAFTLTPVASAYDSRLAPLFGFTGTPRPAETHQVEHDLSNKVFDELGLSRLLTGFSSKHDAGETLIHFDEYDVLANDRYGIQAYSGVRVVWIYNTDVPKWRQALTDSVSRQLEDRTDQFSDFPNYPTFAANTGNVIDLSREQVNALGHLSCWNVTENADAIFRHLQVG